MKTFSEPTRKRLLIAFVLALTLILVNLITFVFGRFSYSSVCTRCGAIQHAADWKIFGSVIPLLSSATVEATPFSTALTGGSSTNTCQHQWMFAQGSGNGVTCAIGSGRHLWTTIRSTNVAALLVWNQKYGDPQFQDRLVQVALDPETYSAAEMLAFDIPDNGFASRDEYHVWLVEAQKFFEEQVTRSKESRLR